MLGLLHSIGIILNVKNIVLYVVQIILTNFVYKFVWFAYLQYRVGTFVEFQRRFLDIFQDTIVQRNRLNPFLGHLIRLRNVKTSEEKKCIDCAMQNYLKKIIIKIRQ